MKEDQKKAGVILSYAGEAVKILVSLVYTPIMLRLLGQSEYGLYQLVYSVVAYLGLLSLGFGSAYMRFYSREKVNGNEDSIARLNGMFMTIFSVISVICILCGLVMIKNITFIFEEGLTDAEYQTARVLMLLLVINLALTFPNSVFNCCIITHERFIFQKLLILLQQLLSPFLTLPLLLLGYGSVGMVMVTTVLTFAVLVTNMFYCLRKLHVRFIFQGFQIALFREMSGFTFFLFLNQIIDQINWSVDKFLLGRMLGTTAVAVYGVGAQINSMYIMFSTSVSNVFVPKVNRIVAEKNDDALLTQLFTKVGRIQFIILGLVLSGFLLWGKPFIAVWAGAEYTEAYPVALLLIIPVTVPLVQNLGIEIQRAKNMHKTRSVVYFLIAVGNIFLSILLIKLQGVTGAAIGTCISLALGNILFMNWYYHYRIGLDIVYFWKQIAHLIPALMVSFVCGIGMTLFIKVNGWLPIVICVAIYTMIYCASMYWIGMNKEEKQLIRIKRLIARK